MMEMMRNRPTPITDFPFIDVKRLDLVAKIAEAQEQAEEVVEEARGRGLEDSEIGLDPLVRAALAKVNMLLTTAVARCRIAPPPPADVEEVTDDNGHMILRCLHANPHKWKLDGTPI